MMKTTNNIRISKGGAYNACRTMLAFMVSFLLVITTPLNALAKTPLTTGDADWGGEELTTQATSWTMYYKAVVDSDDNFEGESVSLGNINKYDYTKVDVDGSGYGTIARYNESDFADGTYQGNRWDNYQYRKTYSTEKGACLDQMYWVMGYTFRGWFSAWDETNRKKGYTWDNSSSGWEGALDEITVYGQWDVSKYSLQFMNGAGNDYICTPNPQVSWLSKVPSLTDSSIEVNEKPALAALYESYKDMGLHWKTKKSEDGIEWDQSDSSFAVWQLLDPEGLADPALDPKSSDTQGKILLYPYFEITYNANDGSATPATEKRSAFLDATNKGTHTVADSDLFTAPSGKTFKEWNTNADGSGASVYSPGDTISNVLDNNYVLYAIWEGGGSTPTTSYDVTLNTNGGTWVTGGTGTSAYTISTTTGSVTLPDSTGITKSGATLVGWSTNSNTTASATSGIVEPGTVSVSSDQTYYAVWDTNVTYNYSVNQTGWGTVKLATTGSAASSATETVGQYRGSPEGAIAEASSNFDFVRWEKSTATGTDVAAGSTRFTPSKSGNPSAYAGGDYTAVFDYTVTFKDGTNTSTVYGSQSYLGNGSSNTFTFPTVPSQSGKVLVGWAALPSTSPTSSSILTNAVTISSPGHQTYYAIWDTEATATYRVAESDSNHYGGTSVMGTVKLTGSSGTPGASASETKKASVLADNFVGATAAVSNSEYYKFVGWSKGNPYPTGSIISTELVLPTNLINKTTLPYRETATYYANFAHVTHTVTYEPGIQNNTGAANPAKAGFVSGATGTTFTVAHGAPTPDYAASATPTGSSTPKGATGYSFDCWLTQSGSQATLAAAVTSDATYYASWKAKSGYRVEYQSNCDTAVTPATDLNWESPVLSAAAKAISDSNKPGYTWGGWYKDSSFSGSPLTNASTVGDVSNNNDAPSGGTYVLYGKWTPNGQTITFHSNYPDSTPNTTKTQVGYTGTDTQLDANTFTCTGYNFDGWATSSSGDVVYADKDTFTPSATPSENHLYAKWVPKAYKIEFVANGGTVVSAFTDADSNSIGVGSTTYYQTIPYGTPTNLSVNKFARTDYVFTGWKDASGNTYTDGQSVTNLAESGTVTLTAQWAKQVNVTYNRNGGTGDLPQLLAADGTTVLTNPIPAGTVVTVGANNLTRAGYTANGWKTTSGNSSSTTTYAPGDTFTVTADMTLYAAWTPGLTTYKVQYWLQDSLGSNTYSQNTTLMPDVTSVQLTTGTIADVDNSSQVTLSPIPAGWVRNDYASGAILSGIPVAGDGSTTMKIYLNRASYTVTYSYSPTNKPSDIGISGLPSPNPATVGYSGTFTVPENPTWTGYVFGGWTADTVLTSTSGTEYAAGTVIPEGITINMPAKNVSIEGSWTPIEYTVTYKCGANGKWAAPNASLDPATGSRTEQVTYKNKPTMTNISFEPVSSSYYPTGFNMYAANNLSTPIAEGVDPTKQEITQDTVFVATFAETFVVTYSPGAHANFNADVHEGLTVASLWVDHQPSQDILDSQGKPLAAPGYQFKEWQLNNTKVNIPNTSTVDQDYTFVAVFEPSTQTVTIDLESNPTAVYSGATWTRPNGEDVLTASGKTETKLTLPTAEQLQLPGYTLTGFSGTVNGVSTTFDPGEEIDVPLTNTTLTPVFTENTITITYTTNNSLWGTVDPMTESIGMVTSSAVGSTPTAATGYQFVEWVDADSNHYTNAGTSTWVDANGKITPQKNNGKYEAATYTAIFAARDCTVVFTTEANEVAGSVTWENSTVSYDSKVANNGYPTTSNSGITENTGYHLVSTNIWRYEMRPYQADGSLATTPVVGYLDNPSDLTITGNVTFYAQFAAEEAYVEYDANGGSGSYLRDEGTTGGSVTLPSGSALSRPGYTFAGWDSTASGNTTATADYAAGSSFTIPAGAANSTTTLYAHWNANSYVITYDKNSAEASGTVNDTAFVYSDNDSVANKAVLAANGFTNSNPAMEFKGWNTKSTGDGTLYAPGDDYPASGNLPAEDVTLYAKWGKKTITVSFSPGSFTGTTITGSMDPQTTDYGGSVTLNPNEFESDAPANYEFKNWLGSDGQTYADGATISDLTENLVLTAQWGYTADAQVYKVYYHKFDGSIDQSLTKTVKPSSSGFASVVPTESTPAHRTFAGWALTDQDYADFITDANTYENLYKQLNAYATEPPAGIDLYPHWYLTEYEIVYNACAPAGTTASGSTASQSVTYGSNSTMTLSKNGFTIPGYVFLGWATTQEDAGEGAVEYADEATIGGMSGDIPAPEGDYTVTLYAVWRQVSNYRVEFYQAYDDSNGSGSSYYNAENLKWTDAIPTPPVAPTNPDSTMTFAGWSTSYDGTGTLYTTGSDLFKTAAVAEYGQNGSKLQSDKRTLRLYARWVQDGYRIDYDMNGGSGTLPTTYQAGAAGETTTLLSNNLTREGYTANGWNTSSAGGSNGTAYASGIPWTFGTTSAEKNLTLYADWTQNHYTITYDANGGTLVQGTSDATVTWGATGLLSGTNANPTRAGYSFDGWFTKESGGVQVTTATTYSGSNANLGTATAMLNNAAVNLDTDGATVTLYAHWTAKTNYKIHYDLGGGTYDGQASLPDVSVTWTQAGLIDGLDSNLLSRPGFDVDSSGWYYIDPADSQNEVPVTASTKYADLVSSGAVETATLHVKWNERTVTIRYKTSNANGSITSPDGAAVNVLAFSGSSVAAGTATALTGYHVVGWYNEADPNTMLKTESSLSTSSTFTPTKNGTTGLWEDATYVALIEPNQETTYTIEHYQQNADDNGYTKFETQTLSATTGDKVSATPKSYTGFTYDSGVAGTLASGEVLADGSLTLKLYYTRATHSVRYAWDGEPPAPAASLPADVTSARIGSTQTTGPAVSVPGWIWQGWKTSSSLNNGDYPANSQIAAGVSFTMPDEDVTLTAVMVKAAYEVNFALDSGSTGNGRSVEDRRDSSVDGYKNVSYLGHVSASDYLVTFDAENYYLSTWRVEQTDGTDPGTYYTSKPEDWPIKGTTTFYAVLSPVQVVSYLPNTHGLFATESGSGTLYTGITSDQQFGSSYYYHGITETNESSPNYGKPKAEPGWKFTGWAWTNSGGSTSTDVGGYYGIPENAVDNTVVPISSGLDGTYIEKSIRFEAQWAPTNQKLTVNPNGGTWANTVEYTDADSNDVAGTTNSAVVTLATNASFSVPGASALSKNGYQLSGWTDAAGNFYSATDVAHSSFSMLGTDTTLTAVWEASDVTITYQSSNSEMGGVSLTSETLKATGDTPAGSIPTAYAGYQFTGWTDASDNPVDPSWVNTTTYKLKPSGSPLASATYTANFAPRSYEVSFVSADPAQGTVTDGRATTKVDYRGKVGTAIEDVTTVAKSGYEFGSWTYTMEVKSKTGDYTQTDVGTSSPANVVILGPTTFTAHWVEKSGYTVNYVTNGGTSVASKTQLQWDSTGLDATTTKVGYNFAGWYADQELTKPVTLESDTTFATLVGGKEPADGTVTLYAAWTAKGGTQDGYFVRYNTDGGDDVVSSDASTYNVGNNVLSGVLWTDSNFVAAVKTPTKAGHLFRGWYTAADGGGSAVVDGLTTYANLAGGNDDPAIIPTIYAKWEAAGYTLHYESNGGSAVVDQPATWFDGINFATAPTKSGAVFDGWVYKDASGNDVPVENGVTSFADIALGDTSKTEATVYAKWLSEVNYTVVVHQWSLSDSTNGFDYLSEGTYWRDNVYVTLTRTAGDGQVVTIASDFVTVPGYSYFSQTQAISATMPAERIAGQVTSGDTNRFYIYYRENSNYTVKYDLNLGEDVEHGATPTQISDQVNQGWLSTGHVPSGLERAGYTLDGWNTEPDGSGIEVLANTKFSDLAGGVEPENNAVTVYAQWTERHADITYTVDASSKGSVALNDGTEQYGSQKTEDVPMATGDSVVVGATAKAARGYHFDHWIVDYAFAGLDTASVATADELTTQAGSYVYATTPAIKPAKDANLYVAATYTALFTQNDEASVVFMPNGATGEMNPISQVIDLDVTIPGNTGYTYPHHTFTGWNTEANGGGTAYAPGSTYAMEEGGLVLYAQWSPEECTVIVADGTEPPVTGSTHTLLYGENLSDSYATIGDTTGYTFIGWVVTDTATGEALGTYQKLSDIPVTGNITVTANWKASFIVKYDLNLGSDTAHGATPAAISDQVDQAWLSTDHVPSVVPERSGYTFSGWNTKNDASGLNATNSSTYSDLAGGVKPKDGIVTLYAQWSETHVDIVYTVDDASKGSVALSDGKEEYGSLKTEDVPIASGTPLGATAKAARGYHFVRWTVDYAFDGLETASATMSDELITQAGSYVYATTSKIKPGKDSNLYVAATYTAEFAQNGEASVVFMPNGATGEMDPISQTIDLDVTIPGNSGYEYPDYVFTGWNTAADGSGTSYAPGSIYAMEEDGLVLYAQWAPEICTVTVTGGTEPTVTGGTYTVPYGEKLSDDYATVGDTSGYTFNGWVVTDTATGRELGTYQKLSDITATNNITITGSWTKKSSGNDPDDPNGNGGNSDDPNGNGGKSDDPNNGGNNGGNNNGGNNGGSNDNSGTNGDDSGTRGTVIRPASQSGLPTTGDSTLDAAIVISGIGAIVLAAMFIARRRREED